MINFFRRLFESKIGTVVSLAFLGLIAFAFAASDVVGGQFGGAPSGGTVAKIGNRLVSSSELRESILRAYQAARRQQPGLDQETFVADAFDSIFKDLISSYTLEEYARKLGFGVSKRLVDARIAENPAFQGVDGKFSQDKFEQILQQNGIDEADLRKSTETELLIQQLLSPVAESTQVPVSFARPYGDLRLEERSGLATFLPATLYAPSVTPTLAQLKDYVAKNRPKYLVPEQRIVRYAMFTPSNAGAAAKVTDEDVAKVYNDNKDKFAASETRLFSQVIVADEAQAKALAAKAASGTLASAATSIGLSASEIAAKTESDLAAASSAEVGKAGFAASQGGIVGPTKVPLGWSVVKLEKIDRVAAKTLEQARPEIEKELTVRKGQEAVSDFFNKVQDLADGGASVEEIAKQNGLQLVTTPAIFANGQSPTNPAYRPDAIVSGLAASAFQATKSGEAQIITLKENEQFAIVDAAKIIPAAVPALDAISGKVSEDWKRAEGARKARDVARKISDRVSKGASLEAAIKAEGAKTERVQRIGAKRSDLVNAQGRIPPEIALLFSMAPNSAKTLEMPNNLGWMVLYLDQSKRGDANKQPAVVPAIQGEMRDALAKEYVEQVLAEARKVVGVKRNEDAITALKADLSGANTTAQ